VEIGAVSRREESDACFVVRDHNGLEARGVTHGRHQCDTDP